MNTINRRTVARFLMAVLACMTLATASAAVAQADGGSVINIEGGQDQGQSLGAVKNLGQTVINFLLNVVAKVIGVAIAVWGITDFVKRDVMWGTVKIFLCGACFFLNQIIAAMSRLGGTPGGT